MAADDRHAPAAATVYRCQSCGRGLAESPMGTAGICTICGGTSKLLDTRKPAAAPVPFYADDFVTLYHGSCADVLAALPDESVDLVFTDPPYPLAFDHVWDELATVTRVMRDGSSLLTLLGHYQMPRVIRALEAGGLTYRWLCIVENDGSQPIMHGWNVKVCFKPILWFTKGKVHGLPLMRDNFAIKRGSFAEAKRLHGWGQAVMTEPLQCLTRPGDVVLDPFAGSGTTLRAAKDLGRKSIGIEIDEAHVRTAARRCAQDNLFAGEGEAA